MNNQELENKKKFLKYIIIGLVVGLVARYLPSNLIKTEDVIMIGASASITFGLIDLYAPTIIVNNT